MAVTPTSPAGSEQLYQQIEHITKSHSLRGSESLCKLLLYLAKQSIDHPDAPLKEYQIATEVYGRHADFDPQSDSTIRVQAGRLRMKLAEYYANEGSTDPLVAKIPKGSYHLVFEPRFGERPGRLAPEQHEVPPALTNAAGWWRAGAFALLTCLIVSLAAIGFLVWDHKPANAAPVVGQIPTTSGPLSDFWRPFISAGEEPWVIFSNAAFVGRPETGMRYYNSRQDAKTSIYDHYTGVGEVLAVHALDGTFAGLGTQIRVKRGSLFSLDDAKKTNLIFVGSPSENLSLLDIASTQEFVFQRVASGARKGDLSIANRHPQAGESESYLASPSNEPLTEDYGIVGFVPGMTPGRFVMILAGTTTFGTQGVVEFVSRPDSVEKVLQQLPGFDRQPRPFEALVRVKIARGVPLESELVALRQR
jgi:hypothetical protein